MISTLSQWQDDFVGERVKLCALPVKDHTDELTPQELALVADSVDSRQQTYSTGRACAKLALKKIDVLASDYKQGLLRQKSGSVDWPAGCVGSISHTNDWAIAAAVVSDGLYDSIGIDVEQIDRVDSSVLRVIATDNERSFLSAADDIAFGRVALFSIKESIYKCLNPIFGEFIRFKDVELVGLNNELAMSSNSAEHEVRIYAPSVRLLAPELAEQCDQSRIVIRVAILDTHVVSFVGYRT